METRASRISGKCSCCGEEVRLHVEATIVIRRRWPEVLAALIFGILLGLLLGG